MKKLMDYLHGQKDEMLKVLRALTIKESSSYDKPLVDQCGEEFRVFFKKYIKGPVEIIEKQKVGNQLRIEMGNGDEQILLLGHLDTVWPQGTLEQMPFAMVGDKAFGPGVFDMKAGLVQGLFALHALQTIQAPLKKKIVFLITTDEEIGSRHAREMIEEEARKSTHALVLEPAATRNGNLKTARKGIGTFRIHIKGQAAHAGIEPEKGRSAVQELAEQILSLHAITDLSKGTTVNVGKASGGIAVNVIAPNAKAEIDIRVKDLGEMNRMLVLMEGLAPSRTGITLEVTGGFTRPPMEKTAAIEALFLRAQKIAKEQLNINLEDRASGGGSDGNFTAQFIPTLDGLGAVGDGAHATHEHIIISQMPVRSALLALLLYELAM